MSRLGYFDVQRAREALNNGDFLYVIRGVKLAYRGSEIPDEVRELRKSAYEMGMIKSLQNSRDAQESGDMQLAVFYSAIASAYSGLWKGHDDGEGAMQTLNFAYDVGEETGREIPPDAGDLIDALFPERV